ncbi:MAG: 2,3-bisphosphoglycerate-independent phosphoglycerate mutase [Anaerolineae bacterium]|nr:2,3-bisphosphoglycerate-independent phosphoglycerate mutase [Anaerolineae bacterium]
MAHKPVMLMILDGWGIREMEHGNAVLQGKTPNYDRWMHTMERSVVDASGEAVGLVPDQMGNSEVGHLNLGAGRIVYQDISRIDKTIKDGDLPRMPLLADALAATKQNGKKVHLIGLLGQGGVHSHQRHLDALLDATKAHGVKTVVHVITDGRDTPPNSGIEFLHNLEAKMSRIQHGVIATVGGRYYIMDRDKRWERTKKAFDALVYRQGERAATPEAAIQAAYAQGVTDEFIVPVVIGDDDSLRVESGDTLIFYNFRADRMRQIVKGFAIRGQDGFNESDYIPGLNLITFTEYEEGLPVNILFGIELLKNTLAEWLSKQGRKQYHSAETEKYPHVTFFFNGRNEEPFPGEDRAIIPSPKVATYDLKPEMSAYELTEATLERLRTHNDDFILVNFANPDMVGHTGSLPAAIKAVETVDECAGKIVAAVNAKGGIAIVTADHGNCERMVEEATGEPHTYHTTNPVSLFVIGEGYFRLFPRGILADVAPTVLDLLDIPQPPEMTGRSLVDFWSVRGASSEA